MVLLKFLHVWEFKMKDAMAMLKYAVLWRKRFGITSLLDADLVLLDPENIIFYHDATTRATPCATTSTASSRTRVSKRSPSAMRSGSSSSSGDNGLSKCLFDFSHMLFD